MLDGVKDILSDATGAVRQLKGRCFKLALTGTPLENYPCGNFSVIDLCIPDPLREYDRSRTRLIGSRSTRCPRLLRRASPVIPRRTKAQILHDLPLKAESEVFLDPTERQKALDQHTHTQVRSTIDDAYWTRTSSRTQFIALTALLKLRQVCLSPRLLTHCADESAPKRKGRVKALQTGEQPGGFLLSIKAEDRT